MRLIANGIVFAYRPDREILSAVDFDAAPGQLTLLIGPNGAGKSTLLKILAGLLRPQAGGVRLLADDGRERSLTDGIDRELARVLAYLPQNVQSPDGHRVEDIVALGRFPHQRWWSLPSREELPILRAALQAVDAEALWGRVFSELSGGEQQSVLLAGVLAQQAPVLLLDEPGKALDIHHQSVLFAKLRAMAADGKTVVAITHDLNIAAAFGDRLVLLHDRRIVAAGRPAAVLTEALLAGTYGRDVRVVADPQSGLPVVLPLVGAAHD